MAETCCQLCDIPHNNNKLLLRLTYIIYFDTYDRTHKGDESPKDYKKSTFSLRCDQRSDMTSNGCHVMYLTDILYPADT